MIMESEGDVGEQLLLATQPGASGKKNKFLRAVYRRAVELQYDQSKAEARVQALVSGKYTIIENAATGTTKTIDVTYSKGIQGRTEYTDPKVELLDRVKLKAVVGLVLADDDDGDNSSREMLKSVNMAGCSPRVFWSLVRLFGADIEKGLFELFPQQNWAFLKGRKRVMSEKAAENKRQELGLPDEEVVRSTVEGVQQTEESSSTQILLPATEEENMIVADLDITTAGIAEWLGARCPSDTGKKIIMHFGGGEAALLRLADYKDEASSDTIDSLPDTVLGGIDLNEWIKGIRRKLYSVFWHKVMCFLCPSPEPENYEKLRKLIEKRKLAHPKYIAGWKRDPAGLSALLSSHGSVTESGATAAAQLANLLIITCNSWISEYEPEGTARLDEEDEDDVLRAEGWLFEATARLSLFPSTVHLIGKNVFCRLDEDNEEQAMIYAYAPPTATEPDALWKVLFKDGERVDIDSE
jgi:hypothetical protein